MAGKATRELVLEGLECVNCAMKIEAGAGRIAGVKSASLDFVSKKLKIEADDGREPEGIVEQVRKLVKDIEPDVEVIDSEKEGTGCSACRADNTAEGRDGSIRKKAFIYGVSAVFFAAAVLLKLPFWLELTMLLISYILSGSEVIIKAVKNILRGDVFDENFLMGLATIGAFVTGEYPEGVAVMLFFQTGELLQSIAVNRSRRSITALMDIRPDYANLKIGDDTKRVLPGDVRVGDIIVVKPGEKVPLDGKIIEGRSMVDTSALTGESVPRSVETGDDVLGGFINRNGLLVIEVVREFAESTVSKILDLVQNASSKKAPTENFITRFARYYTPVVTIIALAIAVIPPLVIPGATFYQWLYKAMIFLVVSCPCALVVSIPLGFFGGIGGASRSGILIKGGNYLEALNSVDTAVFDKTGTLTKGIFKVTQIKAENWINNDELLEFSAFAECYSNHPIAQSILKAYGREVDKNQIESYDEIPGHGVRVRVKGTDIIAGNTRLMSSEGVAFNDAETVGTVVHLAANGKYAGYIVISDEIKEDAAAALRELKAIGVKNLVMLTGDRKAVADKIGSQLGVDVVYSELLPDQKVEKLEQLESRKQTKGKLIFVGDGINDAPVLARADVGVAMGGLGSDAAIEAADVVLMTDEPSKLVSAIKIAKRTKRIVWQNIVFALGVKAAVQVLAVFGIATMWEAVFADVGVTLIAVINSMRVMKVDKL